MKVKRITAVLLALLMLALFTTIAVADTMISFSIGDIAVAKGGIVSVPLSITTNVTTDCLGCLVRYDPEKLTYVDYTNVFGYRNSDFDVYHDVDEPGKIEISVISEKPPYDNATLFNLNFRSVNDIGEQDFIDTDVTVEFVKNGCIDEDDNSISQASQVFEPGVVVISQPHEEPTFDLLVNGEAIVGHELEACVSNFSDEWDLEPSYEYKWCVDGVIKGSNTTYTPSKADVGGQLTLEVTATVDAPINASASIISDLGLVDIDHTCGINLMWSFENGVLSITGFGDMYDYSEREIPWKELDVSAVFIDRSVSGIYPGVFADCQNLTEISVDAENPFFSSRDGNLLSYDGKVLYQYALGKTDRYYEIPGYVEKIESSAFRGAGNIESVILFAGVKEIGDAAFEDSAVENVYFTGDEEQWSNIQISGGSTLPPAEFNPEHENDVIRVDGDIQDVSYDEDKGEVAVDVDLDLVRENCSVLMGVYSEDETLLATAMGEATKDDRGVTLSCPVADEIENCHLKVFFWNGFDERKPVGHALEEQIK